MSSNKLATPGIIWLADGQADDVAWMIEGLSDEEIRELSDEESIQAFVKAHAESLNDYVHENDPISEEDIEDAVIDLGRIIRDRLA